MSTAAATTRYLPLRLPNMCVVVVGKDAGEMIEKADAVVRDNPFIEFRLDYLRNPAAALLKLRRYLDIHPELIAVGTCRRVANGGKFRGSLAAQVQVLMKAADAGCQIIDIDLQSAAALKPSEFNKLHNRAAIILSYHDFRGTKKLDETFRKMRQYPADFYKVVSTAANLTDNVTMMQFLQTHSGHYSMVGLCMGEQGIISRVLGVRAGSVFTYGAVTEGDETAPGQITARTLRDTYRIAQVDAATRVYGVAGDPIAHSLSPMMLNAAFRRENVNAVFVSLHAKTLPDLMTCVREIPIHGLAVTMPYKQDIMEYLDNTDPVTAKVGACNTVVRAQDGKLYGFNTDVAGVVRPLEQRMHLEGAKILVLGAGGAARAAVFGLRERGAEVHILNRHGAKAQKLARSARARVAKRNELKKTRYDVIINATPVGMGNSRASILNESEINCRYLMDMVYNPTETKLIRLARARGAQIITGAEMFANQGARQFEIWTGKPAPLNEMYSVVSSALDQAETEKKKSA